MMNPKTAIPWMAAVVMGILMSSCVPVKIKDARGAADSDVGDADVGTDSDSDTDADSGAGSDTDTDTDAVTDADSDADTSADADTNAGTGTGTGTEPQERTVRVFWLRPNDYAYDQTIVDGITNVMKEAQRFYFQELGQTFRLNDPIVEICDGDNSQRWYETDKSITTDPYWISVFNGAVELKRKYGLQDYDPRWVVVEEISAEGQGAGGGGGGHWVLLPKHDVDGAAGYNGDMNRWYGGMVHELGHAFMLPDSTYTDGTPMSASFYDYPNCHFTQSQIDGMLNADLNAGFFTSSY